jgi:hypothetical protein
MLCSRQQPGAAAAAAQAVQCGGNALLPSAGSSRGRGRRARALTVHAASSRQQDTAPCQRSSGAPLLAAIAPFAACACHDAAAGTCPHDVKPSFYPCAAALPSSPAQWQEVDAAIDGLSYVRGRTDEPLLEETVGQCLDRTAAVSGWQPTCSRCMAASVAACIFIICASEAAGGVQPCRASLAVQVLTPTRAFSACLALPCRPFPTVMLWSACTRGCASPTASFMPRWRRRPVACWRWACRQASASKAVLAGGARVECCNLSAGCRESRLSCADYCVGHYVSHTHSYCPTTSSAEGGPSGHLGPQLRRVGGAAVCHSEGRGHIGKGAVAPGWQAGSQPAQSRHNAYCHARSIAAWKIEANCWIHCCIFCLRR